MAFSREERSMLSGMNRLKGKGKNAVEAAAGVISHEGERYKRFLFTELLRNVDTLQLNRMREFLRAGNDVPLEKARESLVDVLSSDQNRQWLEGVLKHDSVVRGFESAGSNYLRRQVGPTLRKALKGKMGVKGRLRSMWDTQPHPSHHLANGLLAALNAVGLPEVRQPTGREPEAVEDPYAGLPDAARRIAHEHLDPIRIPLLNLVQRGLHQHAISKMSESHRTQVQHTGRVPHYASNLIDTAAHFVTAMAGEGLSGKRVDVSDLVTHAWNSANFSDFRQRMTLAVQHGVRKIDANSEEAHFLKRFFTPLGAVYAPSSEMPLSEDDVSAHNIHELHRMLSTGKDLVPWTEDQKSARAFYEMVRLAKVAGGTKPTTPKVLRDYVIKVYDEHRAFKEEIRGMSRARRVSPRDARNMFVRLVMEHGTEEGPRLHEELMRRARRR